MILLIAQGLVWLVCSLLLFIDIWKSLDVVVVITLYFLNGFMELDLAGFMLGLVFFPRGAEPPRHGFIAILRPLRLIRSGYILK